MKEGHEMDNKRNDLVKQGNEAFESHKWKEAIYFFGQASQLENTFDVNKKIVVSLLKIGLFDDAVDQASIFYDKYLENKDDATFLFNILIESEEFLLTYQFLEIVEEPGYKVLDEINIQQIYAQLSAQEKNFNEEHTKEIEDQKKELMSLVTMQAGVQASKIRNMKYLPMSHFLEISENLLLNPYLHPLFKNEIIENLVKLKINEEYSISFFGELRKFNPSKLRTLMFTSQYMEARKLLLNKLSDYDDYESNLIMSEFSLYISMSYPFVEDIISNAGDWIEVYLCEYREESIDHIHNSEKISMWLDHYKKLLETFEN